MLQIVTANRLADGFVVYRTPAGQWSERLADAASVQDEAAAAAILALAVADAERAIVIAPYMIEVQLVDGHTEAVSLREKIRATGPTIKAP